MDNGFRRRGCGSEVDDLARGRGRSQPLAAVISTGSIGGGRAGAFAAVISTGSSSGGRAGAFAAVISTGSISGRPVRASPADQRPRRDRSQPTGGNPTASPPLARVRHSAVGLPTYPTKDRQRVPAKAAVISTSSIGGGPNRRLRCGDLDKLDQRPASPREPCRPTPRRDRSQPTGGNPTASPPLALAGAVNPPPDRAQAPTIDSPGEGQTLGCRVADVPDQGPSASPSESCGDLDKLDRRWPEQAPSLR